MINSFSPEFIKNFIKNPTHVGAIAPSSKELARVMIRGLALNEGEAVLELGPGTGAFTCQIRNIIPDSSAYIGIEREASFCRFLERRFPELQFVNGNAAELDTIYPAVSDKPAKVIISGLPFATLMPRVRDSIIDCLDQLMTPGTIFRTFQSVNAYPFPTAVEFRERMYRLFGEHHRSKVVFRNLPPAFVLTWQR